MYIIFLALINTLIGTILAIKWKQLSTKGLNPISALGLYCFGIPLWLASLIILSYKFDIVYSREYFLYVFAWAIIVIITNIGSFLLMKFQTLSELTIYKLGFSTTLGIIVDSIFFKINFSFLMLTGVIFLFISGILLSKNKKINDKDTLSTLPLMLGLSILGIFQFSLYKYAVVLQPNPIVHGIISQLVIYISFAFFSYNYLQKDYKLHLYNRRDIIDFSLLIFLFTITEAFLFKELPLTIIILLSVISLLIYAVYDIKKKDIILSRQIYLAGALSAAALIMLNTGK